MLLSPTSPLRLTPTPNPSPQGGGERRAPRAFGTPLPVRLAALLLAPLVPRASDGCDSGRAEIPYPHRPHRRRGELALGRRQARVGARSESAGGKIHRPARRLHHALAAGLSDRGLRLPAGPPLADRPARQEQRRHPDRGAQRPQGAHRGRPRARAAAHRPDDQADRRERHPAGVPAQRFRRRHQGRRARHPRRAAGRCRGGEAARQGRQQALAGTETASCRWRSS